MELPRWRKCLAGALCCAFLGAYAEEAGGQPRSEDRAEYPGPILVPTDEREEEPGEQLPSNAGIDAEDLPAPPPAGTEASEDNPLGRLPPAAETEYQDDIQRLLEEERIDLDLFYRVMEDDGDVPRLPMSVRECVRMALDRNDDIIVASHEPLLSETDVFAAHGEFDPVASSSITYTLSEESAPSDVATFAGVQDTEAQRTQSSYSLSGLLRWGTRYDVTFNLNKDHGTFTQFRDEWSGGLNLSLTQPLLQGRGQDITTTRIQLAEKGREASQEQLMSQVLTTVAEVVDAYWDVVAAEATVEVREESVENAERLVEMSKQRFEIGEAASIDVLQARSGVAARQGDLISARAQLRDAEDRLKQLMSLRDNEYLAQAGIQPVDEPSLFEPEFDEHASVQRALANRPEIQAAELEIESAEIEQRQAADEMHPELDASGTVSAGGREESISGVFEGTAERADRSYNVGVQGSVPIPNRAARGNYQRSRISTRQAEDRLRRTQHELMLSVRLAIRAVETARVMVESSRQTRRLQEANVAAEEKRLELGTTTSYRVLEVQEDLTEAQVQEVQAMANFEQALTELRQAEGILLQDLGVEFDMPESAKPTVPFLRSLMPVRVTD
ncbi:MAG: TolC family protein [Candidatus Hydrogenedentota bacterium]